MRYAVGRLRRRPDFLRVASARRSAAMPGLVLQVRRRARPDAEDGARVGFTASRKVGGAVARNRARRRLRAVAGQLLPRYGAPDHDYVVIARRGTADRAFPTLLGDLESAMRRLDAWHESQDGR